VGVSFSPFFGRRLLELTFSPSKAAGEFGVVDPPPPSPGFFSWGFFFVNPNPLPGRMKEVARNLRILQPFRHAGGSFGGLSFSPTPPFFPFFSKFCPEGRRHRLDERGFWGFFFPPPNGPGPGTFLGKGGFVPFFFQWVTTGVFRG